MIVKKEIRKVGVVGAGQMGIGITQVASQIAKVNVVLMDVKQSILDKSLQFMGACIIQTHFLNKHILIIHMKHVILFILPV
jgi:3-hydroxyacyl-CoA dehydrogenase